MNTKVFHFISGTILLLTILVSPLKTDAQSGGSLKINYLSPDYPQIINGDSALEGTPYSNISLQIINLDTGLFSGNLYIELQGDTGTGVYVIDSVPLSTNPVTIPGSDSTTVSFDSTYYFIMPRYKTGSNIVVVWPRLTGGALGNSDSLQTEVYFVPSTSGINDLFEATNLFYLYPNPSNDFIGIIIKNEKDIERVRFYDLRGRLLREVVHLSQNKLDVRDLSNGCYFLELILNNRQKMVGRFMKL